jgi:hypothetical protein
MEHAVAYFGSRILYPSRPGADYVDGSPLTRAALEKAARGDGGNIAQEFGYRIGDQIYDAYLAGKVKPRALRRLFLARLDEPGMARKVCTAVMARLRAYARRTQVRSSNA